MRALYYFMLYKTYGGVPIVNCGVVGCGKVTADKFYVERATPEAYFIFHKRRYRKNGDQESYV